MTATPPTCPNLARADSVCDALGCGGRCPILAMCEALRLAIHGLDTDGPASAAATLNVQGRAALAAAEDQAR